MITPFCIGFHNTLLGKSRASFTATAAFMLAIS
jgi:hypothetical protein